MAMLGNLSFSMRSVGSGTDWIEVFNQTVNGTFSVQHFLTAAVAQIAAGEIELQVRFYPDSIEATDDANMSSVFPDNVAFAASACWRIALVIDFPV